MTATKSNESRNHRASLDESQRRMLKIIEDETAQTAAFTGRRSLDDRVIAAIAKVARHEFVPAIQRSYAYCNEPLPIGHGQTISQPFIVALMTELLEARSDHIVLEVGTGSGYQAAILSQLAHQVYSIEVVPELAEQAAERFEQMGYRNVKVRQGDGALGWADHAPFDRIIVTAAAPDVPDALVEQLKPGGRMVLPVGGGYGQELVVINKSKSGQITQHNILAVAFVPLVPEQQ